MLKDHTQLRKVKLFKDKKNLSDEDKIFQEEVNFYTDIKSAQQKKKKEY